MASRAVQWDLFGATTASFEASVSGLERIWLDAESWVDHAQGWVSGADALFREVLESQEWDQRLRRLYDRELPEPRLTAGWTLESGAALAPVLERMRTALSSRYGVAFDSVGFNLYRDGRDSVAWHRDHIAEAIRGPVVALVSLGEPRRFALRPKGGGASRGFRLGRGDLLVTGGQTPRTWEHSVPRVARAGPRISLAFRHGLPPAA